MQGFKYSVWELRSDSYSESKNLLEMAVSDELKIIPGELRNFHHMYPVLMQPSASPTVKQIARISPSDIRRLSLTQVPRN